LLTLSLISLAWPCDFSPCVTSVGWLTVFSMSHVVGDGDEAPNRSGAVRALSRSIVIAACGKRSNPPRPQLILSLEEQADRAAWPRSALRCFSLCLLWKSRSREWNPKNQEMSSGYLIFIEPRAEPADAHPHGTANEKRQKRSRLFSAMLADGTTAARSPPHGIAMGMSLLRSVADCNFGNRT
jgi:hypothetical protein